MELYFQDKTIIFQPEIGVPYRPELLNAYLNNPTSKTIQFRTEHISEELSELKKKFIYIEAAGGLVYNKKKELLVIQRFGVPDLPKGKIETGEHPPEAALREVSEECGIMEQKIVSPLPASYHIYRLKNGFAIKKTHWFTMRYNGIERLMPQTEEDISAVFWADKAARHKLAEQTYPNLRPYFLL